MKSANRCIDGFGSCPNYFAGGQGQNDPSTNLAGGQRHLGEVYKTLMHTLLAVPSSHRVAPTDRGVGGRRCHRRTGTGRGWWRWMPQPCPLFLTVDVCIVSGFAVNRHHFRTSSFVLSIAVWSRNAGQMRLLASSSA